MNHICIILLSASDTHMNEIRKDAHKLARMYFDAELEEDPAKQEKLLIQAEKFAEQLEKKHMSLDEETYNTVKEIMDDEAEKLSKMYFENFTDEDFDED
jgi:hypothetical protein